MSGVISKSIGEGTKLDEQLIVGVVVEKAAYEPIDDLLCKAGMVSLQHEPL